MDVVAGILLVVGSLFILLAAIGVTRFDDVYARLHAGAKAPTLGIIGIGAGAAIMIGSSAAVVTAILVVLLQLIAGPVGAHILGRSVYRRLQPELDGPDELGDPQRPADEPH